MTKARNWSLESVDGFTIYGLLNSSVTEGTGKALLLIHGMTGSPKEAQHEAAAQYFSALGYDVIRPFLYCMNNDKKNCRKFQEVTLAIHAKDINTIVDFFAPSYKTLYAAGHSYGGPSIMLSDMQRYRAICLWDPTFKQKSGPSSSFVKDKNTDDYVIEWDHSIKPGKAFVEENIFLGRSDFINMSKQCRTPVRVIFAGDGDYIKGDSSYHNFVMAPADAKIVPGTDHCFIEPGTTEPLLNYTREWFEKFYP